MTFLELINEVLSRLREEQVSSVNETPYSAMIGLYVNDAKRQVEDAWEWDALGTTIGVPVIAGTSTYVVAGSGTRQKNITANITTTGKQYPLRAVSPNWIQNQQQLTTTTPADPCYYAWNGSNVADSKSERFPTPVSDWTIMFNMNVPQSPLTLAADVILAPSEPVIAGAFARALVERGEDGGLSSGEAYSLFKSVLADSIAIQQTRQQDYDVWEAT